MSELTGDPVLDHLEELYWEAKALKIELCMPRSITPCCDEALRALLINTREVLVQATGHAPQPKDDVMSFIEGGKRPSIID
ncbi:MAG: hypothetical protein V1814_00330 [Candidatus Moraniibacteriota bacterium]